MLIQSSEKVMSDSMLVRTIEGQLQSGITVGGLQRLQATIAAQLGQQQQQGW
ncbi:Uncharacterised protein [Mycobacteroides abscessus subsp. abscessus]|nr:Uncharacterised protein [Mycobacteroides abscessus subsp. abscessus]